MIERLPQINIIINDAKISAPATKSEPNHFHISDEDLTPEQKESILSQPNKKGFYTRQFFGAKHNGVTIHDERGELNITSQEIE